MSIRAKGGLGKLTGKGGVIRKEDKEKTTKGTKKTEGNLKSKVTQTNA